MTPTTPAMEQRLDIARIEGNKLTIDFDRAGQKRVLDGFVSKV